MKAKVSNCYVLQRIQHADRFEDNPKELFGVFVGKAKIAKSKARIAMMNLLRSNELMPVKDESCSGGGIEIWWHMGDMFLIERQIMWVFK